MAGNGLEIKAGPVEGKAWGANVLTLIGFAMLGAAILYQGHLLREEVRSQTIHFNGRVDSLEHEIERTCKR